ncbi:MAG TPA: hypothetical protein VHW09_27200 [Bryobacteraceae bacterium]|jgi:hypothetical protein|nr:hypothetical protein [Bryobacteraceae bacterium]
MPDRDRLSSLILVHWETYHPTMFRQLLLQNRLETELEQTAEQFSSFLYELVSVRKLEYHKAWELALDEFLPPEESSSTSPSSPPAISESPQSTESGWVASMRRRAGTSKPSGS